MKQVKILVFLIHLPCIVLTQSIGNIEPITNLIQLDNIKETFIYWGESILVVAPDTINGTKIIRAFHTPLNPNFSNDKNYDNDILDYETLKPLTKHRGNGSTYYDYSEKGKVKIRYVSPSTTKEFELPLNKPVFNLQGPGAGILVSCLNLKVRLKTSFSVLSSGFPYNETYDSNISDYTLEVLGEEIVTINDKSYEVFVVEISSVKNDSGVYYKSWVTKESPHMALKFIYSNKSNPNFKNRKPYAIRGIF